MTAKTPAQRHKAWRERQDRLGLKRVCGYVLPKNVAKAKKLLSELRGEGASKS